MIDEEWVEEFTSELKEKAAFEDAETFIDAAELKPLLLLGLWARDIGVPAIKRMLPIVEAAYWDEHTAGTLPGSGFNHKAQHLAGPEWGWQKSDSFKEFVEALEKLPGENK